MIREALRALKESLAVSPSVALLGPRQVGKTTLALAIAETRPAIYLDLESPTDRNKLSEPEAYLEKHADKLVILDEVHRMPDIFAPLRGLIDKGRRAGREAGQFLFLGSASGDLLRQTGESLAGRITYLEMTPFSIAEVPAKERETLWVRGGFPRSFLAKSPAESIRWRRDFLKTYLERDVPQFGIRIPAETLRRFWTMLAHRQSALHNASALAESLGADIKSVNRYTDLLTDLLLLRRLEPWHTNVGKRLVKSPKMYVRDTGLLHALLGIADREALLGHPVAGASWETFVVENLVGALPAGGEAHFYRTQAGAEIDLVLRFSGGEVWAIEIKHSSSPQVRRGFHLGCEDIGAGKRFCVYTGKERYPLANGIEAVSLRELREMIKHMKEN